MTPKILVLQITRVGDILQTTPLLRGLRESNPEAFIAVLVNKRFEKAIVGNPDVDEVFMMDSDFLTGWDGRGSEGFMEGHARMQHLCGGLRRLAFDKVINASFNDVSATLTALIKGKRSVGFVTRADGTIDAPDFVSRYVHSQVQGSRFPQPHIADILQCLGGIRPASRGYRVALPDGTDDHLEPIGGFGPDDILVGIQPGSNTGEKGLPAEFVSRVIDALSTPKLRFAILGGPQETSIFEAVAKQTHAPLVDLTGIGWEKLGRVLARLKILVSGDTAPAHLAAALNTQVLMIFRGISHYSLTGPYGNGHFALDPPAFSGGSQSEHPLPSVDGAVCAVKAALGEDGSTSEPGVGEGWTLVRSHFDEDGWLSFETTQGNEPADSERMGRLLKSWWKRALLRELGRPESAPSDAEKISVARRDGRNLSSPLLDETITTLAQADSILGEAIRILESGANHGMPALDRPDEHLARLAEASPGRFLVSFLEYLRTDKSLAMTQDPTARRRGLAAVYAGVRHSLRDFGSFVCREAA